MKTTITKRKTMRVSMVLTGIFALLCTLNSLKSFAQTVLLSPTVDGGFENATSTFAANNWLEAQPGAARQWRVGTAAGSQGGTKAAYVGAAANYNGNAGGGVMHFYRDLVVPAGATNVLLTYYYRQPITDNTFDYFYIYTTTTANTPVSGTIPGSGYTQQFVNTANAYANFTLMPTINLTSLAGTTVRLVFTWVSDGATPNANPAVDNVSVTYTPGVACSGTPAGGTTISTPASVCSATSFTLSLSGSTVGTGLTYQWQSSPTGVIYSNIGSATSTTLTTTQASATYYRCRITCTASAQSANSSALQVTMQTGAACLTYCASNATSNADDEILNVNFGSMSNSSTCATTAPGPGSILNEYSNYKTTVSPPNVTQGATASGSVTIGYCNGTPYTTSFAVYIDWNQNGVFTDAGEMVNLQSGIVGAVGGTAFPFTTTVPMGAVAGNTVMRIVDDEFTGTPPSCGTYTWGETEDYLINVVAAAPCSGTPAPGNTISSANPICSGINFTLSLQNFTSGSGVTYQWQSSPTGITYSNITGATTSTYTASQTSATYYRCLVICSGNTGISTPLQVNMQTGSACLVYCTCSNTTNAIYFLNGFSTTGGSTNITNNSSGFSVGGYGNFTGMSVSQLPGNSINYTAVMGGGYDYGVGIWVDWNQDGDFADAGEQMYNSAAYTFGPVTGSFTVPLTATTGVTRMRIVVDYLNTAPPACDVSAYEEAEDYTFNVVVPTPCSGTPAAGTASSSVTTICGSGTTNLSLSGATTGSGLSYQWQQSFNAGPYSNISGATTTSYTTGTFSTSGVYAFKCIVTCANSGLSAASSVTANVTVYASASISPGTIGLCAGASAVATASPSGATYLWSPGGQTTPTKTITTAGTYTVTVTQGGGSCVTTATATAAVTALPTMNSVTAAPTTVCSGGNSVLTASATGTAPGSYCVPTTTNGCLSGDQVLNVHLSTASSPINNTTGTCLSASYSDYTGTVAAAVTATGVSIPITVTVNNGGTEYAGAWIDYNRNGTFEASEFIDMGTGVLTTNWLFTSSVTIPATALNGTTRLRVRSSYAAVIAANSSCAVYSYGETEDYLVTISGGAPPISYSWSPGTFLPVTTGASVTATALTAPITYTVVATQTTTGCTASGTASVAVNPLPVGSASPQSICSGSTSSVALSSTITGTTFTYTATVLSGTVTGFSNCTTGACTSSGSIAQTLTNSSTTTDGIVRYTITPTAPTSCVGATFTVDVTVKPKPAGNTTNATICSGGTTSIALGSSIAGTTYTWTGAQFSGATITGEGSGSGTPITQTLVNTTNSTSGIVRYTIVPTANGCAGNNFFSNVTVNPTPVASSSVDPGEFLCDGTSTNIDLNSTTGGVTTYTWSSTASAGVGGNTSGTANPIADLLTNSGTTDGTATYSIIPTSAAGCTGGVYTITETIGATPVATTTGNQTIYSGGTTSVGLSSNIAGTDFSWSSTVLSGSASGNSSSPGGVSTIAETLTNTGTGDAVVEYTISSVSPSGCPGADITVDVTISSLPTITCPSTANNTTDAGMCTSSASIGTPSTTGASTTVTIDNAGPYTVGTTTVTWTVTDGGGNTASCTQTVNITDAEAPVLTVPATANISTDAGMCTSSASIGTATATDNCSVSSVTVDNSGPYSVGATTVTWTATDASGNTSTGTQTVNITDAEAPALTVPATATITTDAGMCTSSASIGTATATDNCSVSSVTIDNSGPYSVGTTTVTWTATDASGNTSTGTQTVNVTDNEMPVITVPVTANISTDAGMCTSSASIGTATATDNCSVSSVTVDNSGPYSVGATTVTWTATDASGNTSTGTQTVNVTDAEAPVLTVPATANISTDAGMCTSSATIGTATATDNCSVSSVSVDNSGPYSVGATTVTWTATDASGNTSTGTQTVNVTDAEMPTITAPADVTVSSDAGVCTASGVALGTPTTADNCSVASTTNNSTGTYNLGANTVTWTVTDGSGNTATATQTVTVTDNQNPTITVPATANITTDAGMCTSSASIGTATATDNCSVSSVTVDNSGPYSVGATTVTWTATDASGNTSTGTQTVNVTDAEMPTITAPANVTVSSDAGVCTASGVALGTPTTADNCSVASTTNNSTGTYNLGANTVTWTVTDGSGNTATATQTVTVTDNQNPTIAAPADVTMCSVTAGVTVSLGTPTTADNCGVASTTNDAPSTFGFGTTIVTWTVTDNSGNTSTAAQNVTVNETPVGSATSIVICNGASGNVPLNSTITGTSFTWTAAVTTGGVIGYNDCTGSCGTNINDVLTNTGTVHGIVEYTVTPATATCTGTPFTVDVTVGAIPAVPGAISGPGVVCGVSSTTYSIAAVPEATTYTWTVPTGVTGMTITGGQGTTAITVTISAGTVIGNVTVTATNNCGTSAAQLVAVIKKPAAPGAISGPASACGLSTANYSIAPVFGATGYSWQLPTGTSVIAGAGTTSVTVSFGPTFISGSINVFATNACGYSYTSSTLFITAKPPAAPINLTGTSYVCGMTGGNYVVTTTGGATGYLWTVPGWLTILSGQGTTGISVSVTGTPAAGTITAAGTNVCGTGAVKTLNLTLAAQPLPTGGISGPANVCGMSSATYSVAALPAAPGYTYTWSTTLIGWFVFSGQGTSSVTFHGPATGTPTAKVVKVVATNSCGNSDALISIGVTGCHSPIANNNAPDAASNTNFSALYPNPTATDFKVDVTTDVEQEITIQVYDVLGNLVVSEKHRLTSGENTLSTDIENYKNGMYFVRLVDKDANTVYSQTVVKQ